MNENKNNKKKVAIKKVQRSVLFQRDLNLYLYSKSLLINYIFIWMHEA